jgi:hypothetical protein
MDALELPLFNGPSALVKPCYGLRYRDLTLINLGKIIEVNRNCGISKIITANTMVNGVMDIQKMNQKQVGRFLYWVKPLKGTPFFTTITLGRKAKVEKATKDLYQLTRLKGDQQYG